MDTIMKHAAIRKWAICLSGMLITLLLMLVPAVAWANFPPIAYAGNDQNVYLGESAYLHGTATDPDGDPIVAWDWEMVSKPDGSYAQLDYPDIANPIFIPDVVGDYVLTLMVSDGYYWSAPDSIVIHASVNQPPTAVIVASTTTGPAPLAVTFDGTGSFDPEGRTLTYGWSFGDGSYAYGSVVSHTYNFPGDFVAALTVYDDLDQAGRSTVLVSVVATNNPPVASPVADPTSGSAPLSVQFSANASDPDGDALAYAWDFGDGATSADPNPLHIYGNAGTYVAWLTVSDGQAQASASITIVVEPSLDLSIASASIKAGKGTLANVNVEADITPGTPAADALVAMVMDGVELFTAPFSDFKMSKKDGPGAYQLKSNDLAVTLYTIEGYIKVIRHNVDISTVDNSNGVQFELHMGPKAAVETVTMTQSGKTLSYVRGN